MDFIKSFISGAAQVLVFIAQVTADKLGIWHHKQPPQNEEN